MDVVGPAEGLDDGFRALVIHGGLKIMNSLSEGHHDALQVCAREVPILRSSRGGREEEVRLPGRGVALGNVLVHRARAVPLAGAVGVEEEREARPLAADQRRQRAAPQRHGRGAATATQPLDDQP